MYLCCKSETVVHGVLSKSSLRLRSMYSLHACSFVLLAVVSSLQATHYDFSLKYLTHVQNHPWIPFIEATLCSSRSEKTITTGANYFSSLLTITICFTGSSCFPLYIFLCLDINYLSSITSSSGITSRKRQDRKEWTHLLSLVIAVMVVLIKYSVTSSCSSLSSPCFFSRFPSFPSFFHRLPI